MTTPYTEHYSTRQTPQSEAIPGKQMVRNSAGGFVFQIDDWARLERFLILGTEKGSYYASEHKLTVDNAEVVRRCLTSDGVRTVQAIVSVSDTGRAPKNDQAIFALGMCLKLGNLETRKAARDAVPAVCRIGTHIFQLAETIKAFGGWGRGSKSAVRNWYETQDPERLAMNLVKYQNRNGWSHKDLLRRGHKAEQANRTSPAHAALYRWVVRNGDLSARNVLRFAPGADGSACKRAKEIYEQSGAASSPLIRVDHYPEVSRADLPALITGFEDLQRAEAPEQVVRLIGLHGLPRECVPTQFLNSPTVWEALLTSGRGMPYTAMIRNLGKMSQIGLLKPLSEASRYVCDRLADSDGLKRARVHPLSILLAQSVYSGGHGMRGGLEWTVDTKIVDALNDAFYGAFEFVEPTGKSHLLGIDVSSSMDGGSVAGTPLTPREAAAAMALVVAKTEREHAFIGYSHTAVPLNISPKDRLDTVVQKMRALPYGGTDASIPMNWAAHSKLRVEVFHSYTDNETWAGSNHPAQALQQYRASSGIPAKLIAVGFTATESSIADPEDAGMLDVVGFDTAAPQIMANFARG